MRNFPSPIAIGIKESAHVGDKTQRRLTKGVDDLGEENNIHLSLSLAPLTLIYAHQHIPFPTPTTCAH